MTLSLKNDVPSKSKKRKIGRKKNILLLMSGRSLTERAGDQDTYRRIRICTNMSRIRNTGTNYQQSNSNYTVDREKKKYNSEDELGQQEYS
jgi:hypothetical protein